MNFEHGHLMETHFNQTGRYGIAPNYDRYDEAVALENAAARPKPISTPLLVFIVPTLAILTTLGIVFLPF